MTTLKLGTKFRVIALSSVPVTTKIGSAKRVVTNALKAKLHSAVAALFRWALSIPAVQQEIADAFDGSTPMCRVMRDAINQSRERIEVDADDVNGLDHYIDEVVGKAFNDFEIDANSIKHLDKAVQTIIEDNAKEIAETVSEHLVISVSRR